MARERRGGTVAGRRALLGLGTALGLGAAGARPAAAAGAAVRVGVLRTGSVAWVLDVARHRGLLPPGVEVVELAGTPATQVALQAGRVDVIAADWLWAARARATGADFAWVPFSAALGALVVPAGSAVRGAADLPGLRIGVAGSPLDKSWLLLRLMARRAHGFDPQDAARPAFGAPPLLAEQLAQGRLDAVLTYWPFVARMEARGFAAPLAMAEVVSALGVSPGLPMVGWTFRAGWAAAQPAVLAGFLGAACAAAAALGEDPAEWARLAPLTGAADAAESARLRAHFRAGLPGPWDAAARGEAARLHAMLAAIGGAALVGPATALPPGLFPEPTRPG